VAKTGHVELPGRDNGLNYSAEISRAEDWSYMSFRRIPLGVMPAIGLAVVLLATWIAALWYHSSVILPEDNPFTEVWYAYSPEGSARIFAFAALGLALACAFPTRGPRLQGLGGTLSSELAAHTGIWVLCALVSGALLVLAKGSNLLEAEEYLKFQGPQALASLSNIAAPVGIIASGLVAARYRVLGTVLFTGISLCLFAYGTRLLAVAPFIFLAGMLFAGRRVRWPLWLLAGLLSYLSLPVALRSRELERHGLIPYAEYLRSHIGPNNFSEVLELVGNFGFTAPIAQFTANFAEKIPPAAFYASINPAPGGAAGWDMWGASMRAHFYIPYSMIGEFANAGMPALVVAMFTWALVCRLCINITMRNSSPLGRLALVAVMGLIAISSLYLLQYNTRSVSRVMTIVIGTTVVAFLHNLRRRADAQTVSADAREEWPAVSSTGSPQYAQGNAPGLGISDLERWER